MEAINYLNTLSGYLVLIITGGGIFSCGVFALRMISAEDEAEIKKYKKNLKNVIKGIVIGITVTGLINYISSVVK
ncbi:MAG: hypothetical protein ACLR3R_18535 [Clostridium paraputrificum]